MTAAHRSIARNPRRQLIYLVATAIMISECIGGGILDLARQAPFYPAMIHLGYPSYFTDILGTAKLLAAAALLAPGLPRLKEWAYAGIMVNMIGAVISHIAVGDGIGDIAPPVVFGVIALLSWRLRGENFADDSSVQHVGPGDGPRRRFPGANRQSALMAPPPNLAPEQRLVRRSGGHC